MTFKVSASVKERLNQMPNRSEFIRSALLIALKNECEFCLGSGLLRKEKKEHWKSFMEGHPLGECKTCHEVIVDRGAGVSAVSVEKDADTEVLSFKVPKEVLAQLAKIENRSQFIRQAIQEAFENICPWCRGSGVLSVRQKKHWVEFLKQHQPRTCGDCKEVVFECSHN